MAKKSTAAAERVEAEKVQNVSSSGEAARAASLKASEETATAGKEAEQAAIAAYRNDEFARDLLQAKVDAGEVAPPDDAPEEVKAKFRDAFESDRQARWDEHYKVQMEATQEHLSKQKPVAKATDEPANVDAPNIQGGTRPAK